MRIQLTRDHPVSKAIGKGIAVEDACAAGDAGFGAGKSQVLISWARMRRVSSVDDSRPGC